MQVKADLSGSWIILDFGFDRSTIDAVKRAGAKWLPKERGGPHWRISARIANARALRGELGDRLTLSPALVEWGRQQVQQENDLEHLSTASSASLRLLPAKLPELHAALLTRPWQVTGCAFMAASPAPLNADEPRMGKTLMTIASVYEADIEVGAHLIICPATAMETVWKTEIEKWTGSPAYVAGEGSNELRNEIIRDFIADTNLTKWLILQPSMVRVVDETLDPLTGETLVPEHFEYPALYKVKFRTVTLDESQKAGIVGRKTRTRRGIVKLHREKTQVTTGSPAGGKASNLWTILNFLDPKEFSSYWRWAGQWLEIEEVYGGHKKVGGIREDRREAFERMLLPYMLRRTRKEVRPEMPIDPPTDFWVKLPKAAANQYAKFDAEAEIRIDEELLTATSILAEYTRLKQFAWGKHKLEDGKLIPTLESGKWEAIVQLLEERGIFDGEMDQQTVIFSQYKDIVNLIDAELQRRRVKTGKITGDVTKKGERTRLQNEFQAGKLQVMTMTTTAGGVAITLDKAQTVIICDETWVPDDQKQAEDRIESMARDYRIGVYYLRSKGTIDEDIMFSNMDKQDVNHSILDARRYRQQAKQR